MEQHPHYWILEPPVEPTSLGVCKCCGATRSFSNVSKDNFGGYNRHREGPKPKRVVTYTRKRWEEQMYAHDEAPLGTS